MHRRALRYEHQVVEFHRELFGGTVWHWSQVPRDVLYASGYLTQYTLITPHKAVRDYGLDGMYHISHNGQDIFGGIQAKYYLSRKVCARDIGTFCIAQMRLVTRNPLSKGFLYTPKEIQSDLRESMADPDYPIQHIKLDL